AAAFMNWITRYMAPHAGKKTRLSPVFTIQGIPQLPEQTLDHWEGYRGSRPVRIGNEAVSQFHNDIYGALMDTFYLYIKYVSLVAYELWTRIRDRLNWICDNWQQPDAGIWEVRGREENYVYSKVMNWVALDRGIRLADKRSFPSDRETWVRG